MQAVTQVYVFTGLRVYRFTRSVSHTTHELRVITKHRRLTRISGDTRDYISSSLQLFAVKTACDYLRFQYGVYNTCQTVSTVFPICGCRYTYVACVVACSPLGVCGPVRAVCSVVTSSTVSHHRRCVLILPKR